jgi:membrane protein
MIWDLVKTTFRDFNRDKCGNLAAALSYYTIFSLAPMLIIVIAVTSLVFGDKAVTGEIYNQIKGMVGPESALSLQRMIESAHKPGEGVVATIVGIATLLMGATAVFTHIQDSLNVIWGVRPKPKKAVLKMLRDRVLSFGMILGVGFLLLVSLVLNAALAVLSGYIGGKGVMPVVFLWIIENLLSLTVTTVLFGMIFKFLPDARIAWRDVRVGAAATAVLFAIGKVLIGLYLGNGNVVSAYGAAGAIVVIILWVNYSSLILFFGAEFTRVYSTRSGRVITPNDYAVQVVRVEKEIAEV